MFHLHNHSVSLLRSNVRLQIADYLNSLHCRKQISQRISLYYRIESCSYLGLLSLSVNPSDLRQQNSCYLQFAPVPEVSYGVFHKLIHMPPGCGAIPPYLAPLKQSVNSSLSTLKTTRGYQIIQFSLNILYINKLINSIQLIPFCFTVKEMKSKTAVQNRVFSSSPPPHSERA